MHVPARNNALVLTAPALAQQKDEGPHNEKARKIYQKALKHLDERKVSWALDELQNADKQDGGHCIACQKQIAKYAFRMGQSRPAQQAAEELVAEAQGDTAPAQAHYQLAYILINEGMMKRKENFFVRGHEETTKPLAAYPNFPAAVYLDGGALAHLHQDEAAKARFQQYGNTWVTPRLKTNSRSSLPKPAKSNLWTLPPNNLEPCRARNTVGAGSGATPVCPIGS